jgi:hypothetical protein
MSSSTKRPKPKPGQTAGKASTGKKEDATQPVTKAGAGSNGKETTAANTKPASATTTGKGAAGTANTKVTSATASSKKPQSAAKSPPASFSTIKRDQKRDEISRKLEERRLQRERERRSRLLRRWAIYGGTGLLVAGIIAFVIVKIVTSPALPPYQTGATIDGIPCETEQQQAHYHAHLEMYVNGVQQPFPSDAGRQSTTGCFYWLHTHLSDGIVHIEAPADGTYTVGQFFDIWGQHLSTTQFLNNKVDSTHKLTIYVYAPSSDQISNKDPNNDFKVTPPSDLQPYTGDPRKIQLKPYELIYIEYGTPVTPQPFSFPAGD